MVEKIYIVWCKTNKTTPKFDIGVFINRKIAQKIAENYLPKMYSVVIEERKLSKPMHNNWE